MTSMMDTLVQAATLVPGGNRMEGLDFPPKFSDNVQEILSRAEGTELLTPVRGYGACVDFTPCHTMRSPLSSPPVVIPSLSRRE